MQAARKKTTRYSININLKIKENKSQSFATHSGRCSRISAVVDNTSISVFFIFRPSYTTSADVTLIASLFAALDVTASCCDVTDVVVVVVVGTWVCSDGSVVVTVIVLLETP